MGRSTSLFSSSVCFLWCFHLLLPLGAQALPSSLRCDKLVLVVLFTVLNTELSCFFTSVLPLLSIKPANTQCSLEAEGQPEGSRCSGVHCQDTEQLISLFSSFF